MKHFKTWKNSESHLPASKKWFIYYNVYKYSTKTKCIKANLSCQWAKWNEKLSQFARWKSLSRTSLWHEDWKWIETTPLGFLFVYDLNFHHIWQSDSERCSKTSLREIHAAAQWQNLASRLKRSWSVNAKSRHAVLLLKQMSCITFTASCPEQLAWNRGFHSLFWCCLNQYSQYLQILMDYIKIWDYIPFKAGHEMWWACISIPSKHSKIKLSYSQQSGSGWTSPYK